MNDPDFESSLREVRPSAPSAALEEHIASGLSQVELSPVKKEREPVSIRFEQAREPLPVRCFHSLGWAIAGAASAVAAIALYPAKPAFESREMPPVQISTSAGNHIPGEPSDPVSPRLANANSAAAPVSAIPVAASLPAGAGESGDFQAAETTRELISTEEGGQVLYQNGNHPMRQVRNLYRERHSWTNARTGARVDIEIPREDVFLQPVSLQ